MSVTVYVCAYVCLCGFFLAQCCHTKHSTLYTKELSSRKEREKERERIGGRGGGLNIKD